MSIGDVGKALRSGQTLEEIAQAHGKTVQEVVDAILAAQRARLDQAVADGKLTQEQADAIYNRFAERARAWSEKGGVMVGKQPVAAARATGRWVQAASQALNMTPEEFVKALREGQTPAQIAEAHGSSGQELVEAIVSAQRAQFEKAVQAGNMTQKRMDRILTRLNRAITKWVEKGFPQPRANW
jgi:3-hydroxyacyl-CoA dehydrogenase